MLILMSLTREVTIRAMGYKSIISTFPQLLHTISFSHILNAYLCDEFDSQCSHPLCFIKSTFSIISSQASSQYNDRQWRGVSQFGLRILTGVLQSRYLTTSKSVAMKFYYALTNNYFCPHLYIKSRCYPLLETSIILTRRFLGPAVTE